MRTAFVGRIEDLIVVEEFSNELQRPKTKELVAALTRWGVEPGQKALLILSEMAENIYLSGRNIENLKLLPADQLNVYDLLHADKVIVTPAAITKIEEVYNG